MIGIGPLSGDDALQDRRKGTAGTAAPDTHLNANLQELRSGLTSGSP